MKLSSRLRIATATVISLAFGTVPAADLTSAIETLEGQAGRVRKIALAGLAGDGDRRQVAERAVGPLAQRQYGERAADLVEQPGLAAAELSESQPGPGTRWEPYRACGKPLPAGPTQQRPAGDQAPTQRFARRSGRRRPLVSRAGRRVSPSTRS